MNKISPSVNMTPLLSVYDNENGIDTTGLTSTNNVGERGAWSQVTTGHDPQYPQAETEGDRRLHIFDQVPTSRTQNIFIRDMLQSHAFSCVLILLNKRQ